MLPHQFFFVTLIRVNTLLVTRIKHLMMNLLIKICYYLMGLSTIWSNSSLFCNLWTLFNIVFPWSPPFSPLDSDSAGIRALNLERT